jgi:hypothetical protein
VFPAASAALQETSILNPARNVDPEAGVQVTATRAVDVVVAVGTGIADGRFRSHASRDAVTSGRAGKHRERGTVSAVCGRQASPQTARRGGGDCDLAADRRFARVWDSPTHVIVLVGRGRVVEVKDLVK